MLVFDFLTVDPEHTSVNGAVGCVRLKINAYKEIEESLWEYRNTPSKCNNRLIIFMSSSNYKAGLRVFSRV